MSTTVWEVADEITCERTGEVAQLLEERAYPVECMPEVGVATYKVLARKCSMGEACNLLEYKCRWSFLNPTFDPFPNGPGPVA